MGLGLSLSMQALEEKEEKDPEARISAITAIILDIGKIYSGPTNANRKTAEANVIAVESLDILEETVKLRDLGRLDHRHVISPHVKSLLEISLHTINLLMLNENRVLIVMKASQSI